MSSIWCDPSSTLVTLTALLVLGRLIAPFVDLRPVPVRSNYRTGSAQVVVAGRRPARSGRVLCGVLLNPVSSST